ncbi:MAG TPA: NUDIX domain-containing protein [Bacteroidia bacterium]|jgi:8-oxo-dGTP pyrophosphatase MutT (NUDIX family)|nr:NUDIX domain-containing protein [Bacteroidia bacterium]
MNKNAINVYVGDFKVVFVETNSPNVEIDLSSLARDVKGTFPNKHEELLVETKNLADDFQKFCNEFKIIEAGGGLIKNNKNQFLFIYRNNKWDLPKGKLGKKEKPDIAAVRECEEECGLKQLTLKGFLMFTYHIYPYKGQWALKKTWWYNMESNETNLVPQLEENITKVEWKGKEDMPKVLKNTYSNIKDILVAAKLL